MTDELQLDSTAQVAVTRAAAPPALPAPPAPPAPAMLAPAPGLEHVARIESHSVRAWPAEWVEHTDDGWILRATPGLSGRGRSNHALTPARPLQRAEFDGALARVADFSTQHGIECGLQVSPIEVHVPLLDELSARGWAIHQAVLVMTADTQDVAAGRDPGFELEITDVATPEWVEAWAHCDGRSDVEAHVQHAFPRMAGIARFARAGRRAVGISVELDGIVGLFCLAVAPELRRQGLGKALVRSMLAQHERAPLTYLQVFSENTAGRALYDSLGFDEAYRYCHCVDPASVRSAASAVGGAAAASGGGC
jgi:ribosomal protein S18 acetylase RimI-like enzyme